MAKVYFAPFCAIKYVGSKAKEFSGSLARPRPVLKKGDIIIVDKRSAFNLVHKGFGEFTDVQSIEFVKKDAAISAHIEDLETRLKAFDAENKTLFAKNVELVKALDAQKASE